MYEKKEFQAILLKIAIWYTAGAPELHSLMDDLTVKCSDSQWQQVEKMFDTVDELMAESEIGSLYQKEKIAARREGRQPRYPNIFEVNEEKVKREWEALEKEYRRKSIAFKED